MKKINKPLVSVIMPMHNSEEFLAEAIDSVLAQTYQNWELLIIDDNSTDGSCQLAEDYAKKDPRISVLKNEEHTGLPGTPRNLGISKANGQYIAFLDSDDKWLPEKLVQQLPFFRDNRTAVVYSDYEKIDRNSNRSARIVKAPKHTDYHQLLFGNVIGNLTGIFDVEKVGKNYFKSIHHEDYAFWLSILKKGYIARNTETITALYREHSSSISSRKWRNITWQWNIYRNIEGIGFLRSANYFISYSIRALIKSLI